MSKVIQLGNTKIGGNNPVSIQSMLNTDTTNIDKSMAQIIQLADNGCDIIRLAVPHIEAAKALKVIVEKSPIPVIADIHFDYKLAIESMKSGVAGIRLNPGNLSNQNEVKLIAEMARDLGIVIRVGANSGSVDQKLLESLKSQCETFEDAMSKALVQSVIEQCKMLEQYNFDNIKVSLKSSSVPITVRAYREFSKISDYPLHIGVTEAGTLKRGIVKSAVGIGALLVDNIGDTLRVSLSADPLEEVKTGKMILNSCGLLDDEVELISCPTCGRTQINLIAIANEIDEYLEDLKAKKVKLNVKKIAVMGCIVNGPGEAREADLGLAGGKGKFAIFSKGEVIGSYNETEGLEEFKRLILTYK